MLLLFTEVLINVELEREGQRLERTKRDLTGHSCVPLIMMNRGERKRELRPWIHFPSVSVESSPAVRADYYLRFSQLEMNGYAILTHSVYACWDVGPKSYWRYSFCELDLASKENRLFCG